MFDELVNEFLTDQRYLTKKELMYRLPPRVPISEFWPELQKARRSKKVELPLVDKDKHYMWLCKLPFLEEKLNEIDKKVKQDIYNHMPDKMKDTIAFEALVDEAYNSSVMEGAYSTRQRSKEMIMKKEIPANMSEQMISNIHEALGFTLENIHKPINEDILLAIYRLVTKNTLDKEDQIKKYRNDAVFIFDPNLGESIYEAPDYRMVQPLMDLLFDFINKDDGLHPIIKSAIIHFYVVYIHPFFDGNGRTARCLAYMYLLQKEYDAFKFFSLSSLVMEESNKYYKAIKDVEENEFDITYFVMFYNETILKSVNNILSRLNNGLLGNGHPL
jgi:Fic family protein